MKRLLAAALALTMVLALAACGGSSAPAATQAPASAAPAETAAAVTENAVYRTLYASEVTTLNYLITGTTNELTVLANVVDGLVEYDSLGNVQPALATSWESNEDATVWTFHIREGVKWVDVNGNENCTSVLARDIRKTPHITESDGTARGDQQKTQTAGKSLSLLHFPCS